LTVEDADDSSAEEPWAATILEAGDLHYHLSPRGTAETLWTRKNPPNYVERSHVLLGLTVDQGRVRDVALAARTLATAHSLPVYAAGRKKSALLAAYAALWEEAIAGVYALAPASTHMQPGAPQFLNVLRVCDVPQALGMLAPKRLHLLGSASELNAEVEKYFLAAGCRSQLHHGP
jgi:hypothetical protein